MDEQSDKQVPEKLKQVKVVRPDKIQYWLQKWKDKLEAEMKSMPETMGKQIQVAVYNAWMVTVFTPLANQVQAFACSAEFYEELVKAVSLIMASLKHMIESIKRETAGEIAKPEGIVLTDSSGNVTAVLPRNLDGSDKKELEQNVQ